MKWQNLLADAEDGANSIEKPDERIPFVNLGSSACVTG
jgi:hypothetical protein